jgi:hypothetical protein
MLPRCSAVPGAADVPLCRPVAACTSPVTSLRCTDKSTDKPGAVVADGMYQHGATSAVLLGTYVDLLRSCRQGRYLTVRPRPHPVTFQVEVKVILRPTVSRPACVGVDHPPGAHDQIFVTIRYLRCSCCRAPSLRRGRVCDSEHCQPCHSRVQVLQN